MLSASFVLASLLSATSTAQPRTILFVCDHGSAKSVVAAAHFNRLAAERGLPFRAVSRGTEPDAELNPKAVKGLTEDGLAAGENRPLRLERSDLETATRVVAFGELPKEWEVSDIEYWAVPAISTDYAASRSAIVDKIEKLLESLSDVELSPPTP